MANILVAGATGFVGSYLVKLLLDKTSDRIFCLSRRSIKSNNPRCLFIKGDLKTDLDLKINIDVIYNCAGVIDDRKNIEAVNIYGVSRLIDIALMNNAILIHLSSAGIYGPQTCKLIIEDSSYVPKTSYESSKLEAEKLILSSIISYGLRASMIRPTTIIGIGRPPERDSFLQLCKAIKKGFYFNINSGKGNYGIIHVHEVCRSLIHLANYGLHNGDTYNLSSEITFRDFSRLLNKNYNYPLPLNVSKLIAYCISIGFYLPSFFMNRKNPLTFSRIRALTNESVYLSDKIQRDLGYTPEKEINQYILETVDSYTEMTLL